MNCVSFPKMFRGNATQICDDDDDVAILQSLHLFLSSETGELFGDPDYGIRLKRYFFDQNNYVLKDILIDEIYTKITTFFPMIYLERKNINIRQVDNKLQAIINCKNQKTFVNNTFNLVLFEAEETE